MCDWNWGEREGLKKAFWSPHLLHSTEHQLLPYLQKILEINSLERVNHTVFYWRSLDFFWGGLPFTDDKGIE